jgi:hypothetical protein
MDRRSIVLNAPHLNGAVIARGRHAAPQIIDTDVVHRSAMAAFDHAALHELPEWREKKESLNDVDAASEGVPSALTTPIPYVYMNVHGTRIPVLHS